MKTYSSLILLQVFFLASAAFTQQLSPKVNATTPICCESNIPSRFSVAKTPFAGNVGTDDSHTGMIWVAAGEFMMGADNDQAGPDEYPKHKVSVNGYWIDQTEVTNAQFAKFVAATGYVTTAERKPNWEELKKQVPPGTPKPADSLLVPASLVFKPTEAEVSMSDYSQWWAWIVHADWKHPQGPQSNLVGKENFPVVQVSFDDAMAYCKWSGKRLPTEAEWEYAARGGLKDKIYPWGNEAVDAGRPKANTWQGIFPYKNTLRDNFYDSAPVKSFPANNYQLYDMAGNVWEWCADYYNNTYYKEVNKPEGVHNPQGRAKAYDPDEPFALKRVVRGGSFLCNDSYCSGYRVARRMKTTEDSGMEHLGFRCVQDKQ
jgi:sulfatase modifying factor 1